MTICFDQALFLVVFLCSRLFGKSRHSPLGRETAIHPIELTPDGWFRLPGGVPLPDVEVALPSLPEYPVPAEIEHDDFDDSTLDPVYQWLRTPWPDELCSLTARPGYLRLFGLESPGSLFRQALIARRQAHFRFHAETRLEFEPVNFQQMAGLIVYYNSSKFHYLYVSTDDDIGKHIGIMSCEADRSLAATFPIHDKRVPVEPGLPVLLRAVVDREQLSFEWALDDGAPTWQALPVALDMRLLTDQAGLEHGEQFTGTFVGMCAHDVSGLRAYADFDYFDYRGKDCGK